METGKKSILVISHSQSGTMELMARHFVKGASAEKKVDIIDKRAADATLEDLLSCRGIAIGSPEYFGYMAGMIKDFFDRTYEQARERTIGLPYSIFVCAGNDGRGAIAQIERIAAGFKWRQVQEHFRVVGKPTERNLSTLEELGQTLATGVEMGIF